jgi:hypothetical protein
MPLRDALAEVHRLHGGRLTETEELLLALAYSQGRPLRAGSDVVDAARLVRARRLVESGMSGAQALAEVGLSEGLHDATLDDALRIGGLRARYVDPFVAQVPANGKPNGGWRKRWGL